MKLNKTLYFLSTYLVERERERESSTELVVNKIHLAVCYGCVNFMSLSL